MSIIRINGRGATATTIDILKEMIDTGAVTPGDFYAVHLSYNAHMGLGAEGTPDFYPVKFKGIREQELWLPYVTLGYRGEGPRGTQTALKLMGFDAVAANEQLLFNQKIVNETFYKDASKDDRIEYHYDLMYKTSIVLKSIINEELTEDTINNFEREAMMLKWEGSAARKFRRLVSSITAKIRFTSANSRDMALLWDIADYPRKCAEAMEAKDLEIASLINGAFYG